MRRQSGIAWVLAALRSSDTGLLILALVVGAGAGGGAIVFRWLIRTFTTILSGYPDYSALGHTATFPQRPEAIKLYASSALSSGNRCLTMFSG